MPENMPKHTLWWGIALSIGGGVLVAFAQPVMFSGNWANTEAGQTFLTLALLLLALVRELVLPLGAALIAAALVMFYIRGRSQPAHAERPKRWVLPDPLERRTER